MAPIRRIWFPKEPVGSITEGQRSQLAVGYGTDVLNPVHLYPPAETMPGGIWRPPVVAVYPDEIIIEVPEWEAIIEETLVKGPEWQAPVLAGWEAWVEERLVKARIHNDNIEILAPSLSGIAHERMVAMENIECGFTLLFGQVEDRMVFGSLHERLIRAYDDILGIPA